MLGTISKQEYLEAVKHLKPKTTSGVDGIPPYILKGCAEALTYPLCILYNLIIKTRSSPKIWKTSRIIPIPKGGNETRIENYRPISIICAPAKVFEHIIYTRIFSHIKSYVCENQHGLIPGRSTTTILLNFSQYIYDAFNESKQVDAVYFDFSKAFDRINHDILLKRTLKLRTLLTFFAVNSFIPHREEAIC